MTLSNHVREWERRGPDVTTAEAERSFSTLRKLKTWLRSTTSENRLNSLSLLNIHRDIDIDIDEIITRYANSGPRRIELIFRS